MAPSVPNPNWPTLFAEGNFSANIFYLPRASIYSDLTPRLYKQWSVRRGKQFELDQVQPGEFHGQWVNTDGALDPSNTTSPFYPGVVPYRGYRMRAQYPPSVNLLTGDVATGGELTPLAVGTSGTPYGLAGASPYLVTASGSAYQGTQVWQSTISGGSPGTRIFALGLLPVVPVQGATYTFTIRVRSATTSANPVVFPTLNWVSVTGSIASSSSGGTTSLTGSPTAPWTTITIPVVVPGPTAGVYPNALQVTLVLNNTVTGTWGFQADGIQFESGGSASTFSVPGSTNSIFTGLVERYPQSWDYTGTYGLVSPVCVDAMALLSQTVLKEAFVMDVEATGPDWFFPLNDSPIGAGTPVNFAEATGAKPPAGVFSSSLGAGTLSTGVAVTAADLVNGKFLGTNGPVITVSNPVQNQGTVVDFTPSGITGPPSSGGWTRMLAFRTAVSTNGPYMASATATGVNGLNGSWVVSLVGTGSPFVTVSKFSDSGASAAVTSALSVADNNWHLLFFTLSSDGLTLSLYVDNNLAQTIAGTDLHSSTTVGDFLGSLAIKGKGIVSYSSYGWQGDLALYAQWSSVLSAGKISSLFTSWKTAWSGESSDSRYKRVLGWAGYVGQVTADSGTSQSLGPANDVANIDALTCLQNVVNTESGRHFIGGNGQVYFRSRQTAFQSVTPVWTFGENQAGGEIPYTDVAFDFDTTRVSNAISVTQVSTNVVFPAIDLSSQEDYGTRNLSRSNQSTDTEEVRSSAYYYLSRYKDPHMRIQLLRVDVASNPSLFSSALAFELGQYVKIIRRDQFGLRPTITMFGFIEQITHSADDKGNWGVELQVSPAPTLPYASFTDLRTTMFSQANAGTHAATITALSDAAVNVLKANLTAGQLLQFGSGATLETLTVAVGGVPVTSLGYASATVQLTSNFAFTHPIGDAVVEGFPVNMDTLAVFDSVNFAY